MEPAILYHHPPNPDPFPRLSLFHPQLNLSVPGPAASFTYTFGTISLQFRREKEKFLALNRLSPPSLSCPGSLPCPSSETDKNTPTLPWPHPSLRRRLPSLHSRDLNRDHDASPDTYLSDESKENQPVRPPRYLPRSLLLLTRQRGIRQEAAHRYVRTLPRSSNNSRI